MITEERKKYLREQLERGNIEDASCPGPPQDGACEFCPSLTCQGLKVNGSFLNEEEIELVNEMVEETEGEIADSKILI